MVDYLPIFHLSFDTNFILMDKNSSTIFDPFPPASLVHQLFFSIVILSSTLIQSIGDLSLINIAVRVSDDTHSGRIVVLKFALADSAVVVFIDSLAMFLLVVNLTNVVVVVWEKYLRRTNYSIVAPCALQE
jgi:hypothetical protein